MKKHSKILGIMTLGALALVGCSAPATAEGEKIGVESVQKETMTVTHKYGEVVVPKNPTSVAVFDFGVLDALQRLGVEAVTGVVQDTESRPDYLSEFASKEYTNIGGLKEPNFEALYELQPEIIFISGRQATNYEELSKIAPVIFMEPDKNDYLGSLQENVNLLANIFGKEDVAGKLLADIGKEANEIKAIVEEQDLKALVSMVSKGEVSVFGEVSRFGMIYNTLGFKTADSNIEDAKHGQVVTFEYLSKIDPDYLFVVDKNSIQGSNETAKDTLNNPLVNNTQVAKDGHIVYLDTISWYIAPGGITASEQMMEDISTAIQ